MNTVDFCYWLQGFFELRDDSNQLTDNQINIIKNHINLALLHEKPKVKYTHENQLNPTDFCYWLQGCLSFNNVSTTDIERKLHNVFLHTIDHDKLHETTHTIAELDSAHTGLSLDELQGSYYDTGIVVKC